MRVAVVTGAAQGIGQCVALRLAQAGYALALQDLKDLNATLAMLPASTAHLTSQSDVTDEAAVEAFATLVRERWQRADVLVNNAGISCIERATDTSAVQFRRVLDVNLTGAFLVARAFGTQMLAQRAGSIVNIASIAGLSGIAERVAYNASKHGLVGMTRTLAAEWGGQGVRCNAVCPGWVKTEMDHKDQAAGTYRDEDITERVPLARFAYPSDIAAAVAFLADPEASGFINGHTLVVDGGWTADASWQSLRLKQR
jgi:NAD(P)-dependent dehydrogenase (short-subunit alcohol dehydrogenase family)